jgi:hypothetical protein
LRGSSPSCRTPPSTRVSSIFWRGR